MSFNRLRLNWELQTQPERLDFISEYVENLLYVPTAEELEMMGRYILWGKNPQNGLNGRQEGFELPTRSHTWDTPDNFESLEALIESPTFSEQIFRKPTDPIIRIPKQKLDRAQIRKTAPPATLALFETLWTQIDELEGLCAQYDLIHGKRKTPIRPTLQSRLGPEKLNLLYSKASKLNIYNYLKKRHELVELRRQQYTLKDSYSPPILSSPTWETFDPPDLLWGEDIDLKPVNLISLGSKLRAALLRTDRYPEPADFTESELALIAKSLWAPSASPHTFDFSSLQDLERFAALYFDLEDFRNENPSSTISLLFDYWNSYVSLSNLKDFQRRILDLKLQRRSNQQIQAIIKEEFGKSYTLNYISTLYHQTILEEIRQTAILHREVLENLCFPENFKTCIDCGRTLLRTTDNFMKKKKVLDGFSPRCKRCEKILREERKKKDVVMKVARDAKI